MKRSGIATASLLGVAGVFLTLWTFPVLWALLTSLQERARCAGLSAHADLYPDAG